MARRRSRRHSRHKFKIPIVTVAILAGQAVLAKERGGDVLNALDNFQSFYTGFGIKAGQFFPYNLVIGYGPWLVKGLVSKVARPMGAAPRVPFGLPISIT